jgi:DNA-binding FadR family transcriptional regulator
METIFSTHEAMVIERTRDTSYLPGIEHRRETVDLHDRLVELINDGNSSEARILARQHLDEGQQHAIKDIGSEVIRVATLRGWELHGLTKRSSA